MAAAAGLEGRRKLAQQGHRQRGRGRAAEVAPGEPGQVDGVLDGQGRSSCQRSRSADDLLLGRDVAGQYARIARQQPDDPEDERDEGGGGDAGDEPRARAATSPRPAIPRSTRSGCSDSSGLKSIPLRLFFAAQICGSP